MIYDFHLPDVGEGISEAVLLEWFVSVGEQVKEGQDLASLSTDKVDFEVPSPRAGEIVELTGEPGETLPVGTVIARIRVEGGTESNVPVGDNSQKPDLVPSTPAPITSAGKISVVAAPATRKLAADLGVTLDGLKGSGPNGQIRREDVERAGAATAGSPARGSEPVSTLRRAMAARMKQSAETYVHSTLDFRVDATEFEAYFARLSAFGLTQVSRTALVAKCLSSALCRHPRLNATIDETAQSVHQHDEVHLGVALASERGLVVPVLRGVHRMGLLEIAEKLGELAARGRENRLDVVDSAGGTFTLSNTGPLEQATLTAGRPVIVPPQSAILWMSRISDQPVVRDSQLAIAPVVNCSLSFDHRYIDGAEAITFINELSKALRYPEIVCAR